MLLWLGGVFFLLSTKMRLFPYAMVVLLASTAHVLLVLRDKAPLPGTTVAVACLCLLGTLSLWAQERHSRGGIVNRSAQEKQIRKLGFELELRGHMIQESRAEAESAKQQADGARARAKKRFNKIKRNKQALEVANSKLHPRLLRNCRTPICLINHADNCMVF